MNICGCLIHLAPAFRDSAREALTAQPGVEIHAETDDGRFVVTVEDTDGTRASETIMALHQIPGVVSLSLNYHSFEDLSLPHPEPIAAPQPELTA